MITLYKYLKESLLDDEEELFASTVVAVINNSLVKELSSKLFTLTRGTRKIEDGCRLENKTLYIDTKSSSSGMRTFGMAVFGLEYGVLSLFKEIKEQTEIECIDSDSGIHIKCYKLDPSVLCKTVKAPSIAIYNAVSVRDMDFEAYGSNVFNGSISFDSGSDTIDLKNIHVNISKTKNGRRTSINFDCVPSISNCKFDGANIVNIRDPFMFDHDRTKKLLDKFFDNSHVVYYRDGKKPDVIKRSGKWIKLKAAVNNKKLEFVSSDNNKIFDVADGARLSDIIDIKAFPDAEYIIIRDNNVSVDFNKNGKDYDKVYYRNHPNILQLPNDPEWTVEVYKV